MPIVYRHDVNPYIQAIGSYVAGQGQGMQARADTEARMVQQQRAQQFEAGQNMVNQLFGHYSSMAQAQLAQRFRTDLQNQAHRQALERLPLMQRQALNEISVREYGAMWDDPVGGTGIVQNAPQKGMAVPEYAAQLGQDRAMREKLAQLDAANMEMGFTDDQVHEQKRFNVQLQAVDRDNSLTPEQKIQATEQLNQRFRSAFQKQPVPRKSPFPKGMGSGDVFSLQKVNPAWPDLPVTRDHRGVVKSLLPIRAGAGSGAESPLKPVTQLQEAAAAKGLNLSPAQAAKLALEEEDPDGTLHIFDPKNGDLKIDVSKPKLRMEARKAALEMVMAETASGQLPDPVRVDTLTRMILGEPMPAATTGAPGQPAAAPGRPAAPPIDRDWVETPFINPQTRSYLRIHPSFAVDSLEKLPDVPARVSDWMPGGLYRWHDRKAGKTRYHFFDGRQFIEINTSEGMP